MDHKITQEKGQLVLHLSGQVTDADRGSFATILADIPRTGISEIDVDLSQVRYIDSVGLGLLVTLRETAGEIGAPVTLSGAGSEIRAALEMAYFDRLFTIR